jgi:pyridoxamine 5'-phosphate oxidase
MFFSFRIIIMNLQTGSLISQRQHIESSLSGLDLIEKECWSMLYEGATKGKSAFHTFVLGTRTPGSIELRTLVLRKVEKGSRSLYTHTDLRSPKAKQLNENQICSLLFYDAVRRIQLRMEAETILHLENEVTDRLWAQTNMSARKSYLSTRSPGERLSKPDDGLPPHLHGRDPRPEESEDGRSNFMVLEFRVKSIDWLFLNAQGHRRASLLYSENGFDANWINP